MSIKTKKHITQSRNSYRWKRIDEFLISKGYICTDLSKDLRVWVDCISNGRDIRYTCYNLYNTDARGRGSVHAQYLEPVFDVMCNATDCPTPRSGNEVLQSFPTLMGAMHCSRDIHSYRM